MSFLFYTVIVASITLGIASSDESIQNRRADLSAQVTIRRDTFGVPHILAQTEEAAAFAHGYVTAEDRLLTLARLFLEARSEEAAYFGEAFAESDFLTKQLRMYAVAESGYAQSPPWVQAILDGYAAGYNRYVEKHRAALPDWVKPVTGVDVLAHNRRVVIMLFSMNLRQLNDIGKKTARRDVTPSLDSHVWGSNMWAIGKERSASGNAILLGNPHQPWNGKGIFYECHITIPGTSNMYGAGLIGSPGISIGFNDHLGWSHTVNLHDSDDVYELTLDPGDEHRYIYDGRSIPMRKEELTIQVKTAEGLVTRKRDVYSSHYGPILKWHADKAYAFKSANIDEYRFVEQRALMGRARNLQEYRHALDMQAMPMFNICYADREGNAFYLFNGRFPDRPPGFNWSGVVPGNTSATEWNRVLPQARLPQLLNPPGGYVQNCNSSPWFTNLRQIIDRRQFPDDLTPNINGLRQQLSLHMLEADDSIHLEEVLRYKNNTKLLLADRIKDDLVKLARGKTIDGISLDEAAEVLESWDNTAARDSKGSVLFKAFWTEYAPKAKPVFATPWDELRPASTPIGIGDPEYARRALALAVQAARRKYGRLDVPWGEVHRLRRGKLDVPIGGFLSEYGAFRIIDYDEADDGKFVAKGGDSFVIAVEFTSPPTAFSILAYSQSDDPHSPNFADQSALLADEKWKIVWFTEVDIAKNLRRTYRP